MITAAGTTKKTLSRTGSFLVRMAAIEQLPQGAVDILEKLRLGQVWLIEKWQKIRDTYPWSDKKAEMVFQAGLDRWCALERLLRVLFDYEDCLIGTKGCDPRAPVDCERGNNILPKKDPF